MTPVKSIFLETNHLFLRDPRGGVEEVRSMRAAGFGAVFCNVGDHNPWDWLTVRTRAQEAGVVCGPWLRTADGNNNFSHEKLTRLIEIADEWHSPLIVNSESELKGSDSMLTSLIAAELRGRDAAISVECWPFANVAWWPLGRYPFLPQIFPAEAEAAKNPEACRDKWYDYGIECVVFTFGSYRGMKPSDFNKLTPYGVYTADDCGGNYQAWTSQGTHKPCVPETPEPEDDMQMIGKDDGVAAEYNALRDMDPSRTLLKKGTDGKWPALSTLTVPVSQWKAWDKAQRRAQILVDDHDEMVEAQKQV